ncbi:DUF982 domain-containing protein [Sinorhizobium meliloti]|nr:DUF982 domain-containing protein [Sinorhizobium meliloti]
MTHLRRVATKTHRPLETAEKRQQINTGRWAAALSLLNTVVFSEAEMNSKMFARPVYLKEKKDLIREITNLYDAIDFLEEWPERDRDIVRDATLKTCYMAHDGHKPIQVARDAIRAFGKKKGILVKAPAVLPWMIKPSSSSGRVSA